MFAVTFNTLDAICLTLAITFVSGLILLVYYFLNKFKKIFKKKTILYVAIWLIVGSLVLAFFGVVLGAMAFAREEVIEIVETIPDTDVELKLSEWSWFIKSNLTVYYLTDEEEVELVCYNYGSGGSYLEDGSYKVINNQDGTFSVKWGSWNEPLDIPKDAVPYPTTEPGHIATIVIVAIISTTVIVVVCVKLYKKRKIRACRECEKIQN